MPSPSEAPPAALRRPASPGEMFRVFTRLALQGFGGVLPVTQRELVERQRWLTPEQFVELLAISQVLPGPNVINLSLVIGDRFFGWRGAMAALAGMLLVPLILVLMLAALYGQWQHHPMVSGALAGMGVAAAGLIIATAIRLLGSLGQSPLGQPLSLLFGALALLGVGVLRWPMVSSVVGLGLVAVATAWWRIKR